MLARWTLRSCVCFAVLLAACAGALPRPTNIARGDFGPARRYLSAVIKRDMAKYGVKGLSIAVIDHQEVVWAEGFGYADVANRVPATGDTVYRIGSISKVVTATEIARLAGQGQLELDDAVAAYVPEFSVHNRFAGSKPITLRSLLAHHSGLPSDVIRGMWVERPVSIAEHVAALRDESLASPPQSLYKYSNIGFSLLGRVIENVERQEFSSAVQQGLLTPLGMADSSFRLTSEIESRLARGYRGGKESRRLSLRDLPAGGMVSSVNDMSRWLRFIFADGNVHGVQIIKPEALHEMFEPQFRGLELDFGHQIGMAWMLSGLSVAGGRTVAWHNGGFPPYQAHLSLLPEHKLGVVILANSDEASEFITQLGTRVLELARETKVGVQQAVDFPKSTPDPVRPSRDQLARYAGHYAMFNGQLGTIAVDGDRLQTSLFGRRFTLQPVGADTFAPKVNLAFGLFSIPITALSIRFQTVQGKEVAVLSGLPAPIAFERIPHTEIPDAWLKRVGTYRTDTAGEQFTLRQARLATESGVLVFKAAIDPGNDVDAMTGVTVALQAITDHEAVVAGIGNGEGGLVRARDSGKSVEIVYSGFRFTRVDER